MNAVIRNKKTTLATLQTKSEKALLQAALTFVKEIKPFIPIYNGALQRDLIVHPKTEIVDGEVVVKIEQSSEKSESRNYAKYQYFGNLRHAGTETKKEPLPDADGAEKGKGDKYLYGYRYRHAVKNGQLGKMSPPMWFERGLATPEIMSKVKSVFSNYFKRGK